MEEEIGKLIRRNEQFSSSLRLVSRDKAEYKQNMNVHNYLPEETCNIWTSTHPSVSAESKLLDDISENTQLLSLFKVVPKSIKTYSALASTRLRNDVSMIHYLTIEANRYIHLWDSIGIPTNTRIPFNAWDLLATERNSAISFIVGNSRKVCDVESTLNGFKFKCYDSNMFNLYPAKFSQYVWKNQIWTTDKYGRTKTALVSFSQKAEKNKTDKDYCSYVSYIKTNYDALSMRVNNDQTKKLIDYYLIPLDMGGEANLLNIIMVNKSVERNKDLKKLNKKVNKLAKKGFQVNRLVQLNYPNNTSFIPSKIIVEITWLEGKETCVIDI